jgi:hypothetical protein
MQKQEILVNTGITIYTFSVIFVGISIQLGLLEVLQHRNRIRIGINRCRHPTRLCGMSTSISSMGTQLGAAF